MNQYCLRLGIVLSLISIALVGWSADYYWVGGSGNWSDLSHWVTSSGGTANHVQVPTAEDNVIFDANSFQSNADIVTINSDNIYFKDMRWDQAITGVTLTGGANVRMNVFGAFVLSPGMNYLFAGDLLFNSLQTEFQDITAHGFTLGRMILFDSSIAKWTINSDFAVDSLFRIQDGLVSIEPAVVVTTKYLECDVDIEGSLILEGTMTVTGSDYRYNFVFYDAVFIDGNNFLVVPSTAASFILTGANATFTVRLNGIIDLLVNYLEFTNPTGTAKIEVQGSPSLIINRASFASNGEVSGQVSMMELILQPSKSYTWEANVDYNIEILNAVGSCSGPINLSSSIPGVAAMFNNDGGGISQVSGEFLTIQDIAISSGVFEVFNSLDLGNTNGWTINERVSQDLYWVGGTGNWDDPANWSTTSGGAGGTCIPTIKDNVFFDTNSFTTAGQSCIINIDDAFCNDFVWNTGGQMNTLSSEAKNIHIGGSLLLESSMSWDHQGIIYLESNDTTTVNSIKTSGNEINKELWLTGIGGWQLEDDLILRNVIQHISGTFITNSHNLDMRAYLSFTDNPRELQLGNSTWTLRVLDGYGAEFRVQSTNFTLDAGTSTLHYVGSGNLLVSASNPLAFNRVLFETWGNLEAWGNNSGTYSSIKYLRINYQHSFFGPYSLDTLDILPNTKLQLSDGLDVEVDYLRALGTCDQPISISSRLPGRESFFTTDRLNNDITNVYIRDMHTLGSGQFMPTSAIDLGNNTGWSFDTSIGRTLFWVGEGGQWEDTNNWSLTSGGPGGECIPTPIDDVIFDELSFSANGQRVRGDFLYFRDMDWTAIDDEAIIEFNHAHAYGSIVLSDLNSINYWHAIELFGSKVDNIFDLKGGSTNYVGMLANGGSWEVQGTFTCLFDLALRSGKMDFADSRVTARNIRLEDGSQLEIDFGNSIIEINGTAAFVYPFEAYLEAVPIVDPANGTMLFTGSSTGLDFNGLSIPLHNVRFTDPDGIGAIEMLNSSTTPQFNKVQFDGDGIIETSTIIDSLLLAPGKSYQLQSGGVQHIRSYFQVLGNNCSSIELSSTQVGSLADIEIDDFEVVGDFIQMRDIRIANGMASYAGIHSTDIANSNVGWIFADAPSQNNEVEGFFGDDQVLCDNSTIVLEAYPFNANATFRWQDNSTNSTLNVDMPGEYWARVTFDGGCSIIDTIIIFPQEAFAVALGADTTLCENESLLLDVSVAGATYNWQDGTSQAFYTVTQAGTYNVDVNLGGCGIQDTIIVNYTALAPLELGPDLTICENDEAIFDVTVPGATYMWQDGTLASTFATDMAGQYFVDVSLDNCINTDTVNVFITPLANVDLGPDTTLCDGLSLDISTAIMADSYLWSNGATVAQTTLPAGEHTLALTLNGCTAMDTIRVDYKPFPNIELGADTTLCAGEVLAFDFTGAADDFLWSDGSTTANFDIGAAGNYMLTSSLDGCETIEALNVSFLDFPEVDLGSDTTLCIGDALVLDASNPQSMMITWQDGSMSSTLEASMNGSYFVDVYNGRCLTTDTIELTFNPRPIFDLGEDKVSCIGETLDLDATVAGATYSWSNGVITNTNTYANAGDHWVDVTLSGCTVRDSVALSFIQIPSANLGSDTVLCEGTVLAFDFSALNLEFQWEDMNSSPIRSLDQPGLYWLEVRDRDCTSRDSVSLSYKPSPTVDLGRDTMLCLGLPLVLSVSSAADEVVTWSDNSTGDDLTVTQSGGYAVEIDKNGCIVQDDIIVTFTNPPVFDLGRDTLICEQQPLLLLPGIEGAIYRWQDGSSDGSYLVDRPGVYEVEVTLDGCSVIDDIAVDTRTCTFYRAYFPEAFSPNADGINDFYRPQFSNDLTITAYNLKIFDRWGNMLFETDDPLNGWDGSVNQKQINRGTYVYALSIEYVDDRGPGQRMHRGEFLMLK